MWIGSTSRSRRCFGRISNTTRCVSATTAHASGSHGYRKVRYKRLAKNQAHLFTLFALGNLMLAGLCQGHAEGASAS